MNYSSLNNTQIFEKISTRDLSGLEKLIAEKVNVNQLSEQESTTPLIEAIKLGWPEGIMLLIKAGADLNLCLKNGDLTPFGTSLSPLGLAINKGNFEIVKLLLFLGAFPNSSDFPLYSAIGEGRVDIVKALISAGVCVNRGGECYYSPLMFAASKGRLNLVKILLEAGANVNIVNSESDETALVVAAHYGQKDVFDYLFPLTTCPFQREWAQEILPRGLVIKQRRDNKLLCDLIEAVKEEDINRVREAIASGVDVNEEGVDGECALHVAARKGNDAIIQILLSAGAESEKLTENNQYTPLKYAAERGNLEAVNTLIKAGANSNIIVNDKTPLMSAANSNTKEMIEAVLIGCSIFAAELNVGKLEVLGGQYGNHLEVIKLLIESGTNINVKNSNGWTALMFAASRNNTEVVKVLISAGADINAKNNYGWTALMYAALDGSKEAVKFLIDAGADINAKNSEGWTALMLAAKSRNLEAYNFLVDTGADIEAKNHEGLDAQYYLDLALAEILFWEKQEPYNWEEIPF